MTQGDDRDVAEREHEPDEGDRDEGDLRSVVGGQAQRLRDPEQGRHQKDAERRVVVGVAPKRAHRIDLPRMTGEDLIGGAEEEARQIAILGRDDASRATDDGGGAKQHGDGACDEVGATWNGHADMSGSADRMVASLLGGSQVTRHVLARSRSAAILGDRVLISRRADRRVGYMGRAHGRAAHELAASWSQRRVADIALPQDCYSRRVGASDTEGH